MKKALLAMSVALLALGTLPSQAATFTSDHCTGGCGPQPTGFATITGTQLGTDLVQIAITPLNGNGLVGGLNGLTTFTFNSTQNQALTFNFGSNAALFDVSNSTTNTASAGAIHQDGFGTFEYGFNYIGGNGASNPFTGSLIFTIAGTGLTLGSFSELSTGGDPNSFLALDIISGTTGRTGVVDCCATGTPFDITPVPLPPALALFGAGLVGIGWLGKRRKRLNVQAA